MKLLQETKLPQTKDFEQFKLLKGNRNVNKKKVDTIKCAIELHGFTGSPIVVNEKGEIIDGQHRYCACKELDYPIQYVVRNGLTVDDCIYLNMAQDNWKIIDYIEFYAKKGNINYTNFISLMAEFSEPYTVVYTATSGTRAGGGCASKIKDGKLQITNEEYYVAKDELEFLKQMEEYKEYFGGIANEFAMAILLLDRYKLIDRERLLRQFEKHAEMYLGNRRIESIVEFIQSVYNCSSKKPVYFRDKFIELQNRND